MLESLYQCDCSGCSGCVDDDDSSASAEQQTDQRGHGGLVFARGAANIVINGSTIEGCTASRSGGGIAATDGEETLTILDTDFKSCVAGTFGGAVFVEGATKTGISGCEFDSCEVAYAPDDVCLTLITSTQNNYGWIGAEVRLYREVDYVGNQVYECPQTCNGETSCDMRDNYFGTWGDGVCSEADGVSLEDAPHECDCSRCKCSNEWPPLNPASIFESAGPVEGQMVLQEQICLPTAVGESRYVLVVSDDAYPLSQSASLSPYVLDAQPHSTNIFDLAELKTEDGCRTPGGGDLYLSEGAVATVNTTRLSGGFASNGAGGSVQLYSEFTLDPDKITKALFDMCQFVAPAADYLGSVMYSAQSELALRDTALFEMSGDQLADDTTLPTNVIYLVGGDGQSASGCAPGSYGQCVELDGGLASSCDIGVCTPCPMGTFRTTPGALVEADCANCERGTFANDPNGASRCESCPAGSYVSESPEATGYGVTIGAAYCVGCPAGKFAQDEGSNTCSDCDVGSSSEAAAVGCSECSAGTFVDRKGAASCTECSAGSYEVNRVACT